MVTVSVIAMQVLGPKSEHARKAHMKLVSGALCLLGAEQAFAHAMLIQFPNQVTGTSVLIPVSMIMLLLGTCLMLWGLVTECRPAKGQRNQSGPSEGTST